MLPTRHSFCPSCTLSIGTKLELVERNYSGCGVDIAYCNVCRHHYAIYYKVDKIEPCPKWDVSIWAKDD